jgi:hypothetical protein
MRQYEGEIRSVIGGVPARILVEAPCEITWAVRRIRKTIMLTTVNFMAFLLSA